MKPSIDHAVRRLFRSPVWLGKWGDSVTTAPKSLSEIGTMSLGYDIFLKTGREPSGVYSVSIGSICVVFGELALLRQGFEGLVEGQGRGWKGKAVAGRAAPKGL